MAINYHTLHRFLTSINDRFKKLAQTVNVPKEEGGGGGGGGGAGEVLEIEF